MFGLLSSSLVTPGRHIHGRDQVASNTTTFLFVLRQGRHSCFARQPAMNGRVDGTAVSWLGPSLPCPALSPPQPQPSTQAPNCIITTTCPLSCFSFPFFSSLPPKRDPQSSCRLRFLSRARTALFPRPFFFVFFFSFPPFAVFVSLLPLLLSSFEAGALTRSTIGCIRRRTHAWMDEFSSYLSRYLSSYVVGLDGMRWNEME
ncbi:hypothetical protein BC567DRAFT_53946 [Phyllosticta citribraziliensis]